MKLLSWNYRGLGNARAVRILGDLVKSHNPSLLFLSETLVMSNVIADLCKKLGFCHFFTVDAIGRRGGLAVLWKKVMSCKVVNSSSNHINLHIQKDMVSVWRLTCYYGFPERNRRQEA